MHFQPFDSVEEMQAEGERNASVAMAGLADAQRSITLGGHWVQFEDLDASPPLVIFGRVATEAEIVDGWDGEDDEGPMYEAANRERIRLASTGLMYGWAASAPYPEGEWGYTHQASVWPIDEVLFGLAKEVGWDITKLDLIGRTLLQIAYRGIRSHVMVTLANRGGDPHTPQPVTRDEVRRAITKHLSTLTDGPMEAAVDEVMALINRA